MEEKLRQLSAKDELRLAQEAQRGYAYLCAVTGEESQGLWAVAHNAALVCFSMQEGGNRKYADVEEVLQSLSLRQIAALAGAYQRLFEEEGEEWTKK